MGACHLFRSGFAKIVRKLLADQGYLLNRIEGTPPPTLPAFLNALQGQIIKPLTVFCFDNDLSVQNEILTILPSSQVVFATLLSDQTTHPATTHPPLNGSFITVIDIDTYSLSDLFARLPWLSAAQSILLRGRFGSFWSGKLDVANLSKSLESWKFSIVDTIDYALLPAMHAPTGVVNLVCVPEGNPTGQLVGNRTRRNQAFALLSTPIARSADFQILAGRGSFGFAAGVFNPGAFVSNGKISLLARGEQNPWPVQKKNAARFFDSSRPIMLTLDERRSVFSSAPLTVEGFPALRSSRIEDFRVFSFDGNFFSNHAVVSPFWGKEPEKEPLQLDSLQTRVGISRLDPSMPRLEWCGFPQIDRPVAQTEKNWSMFSDGNRLFLLYSFTPYILLAADNWPKLQFKTIVETAIDLPFGGDGLAVRNSINPVDYDEKHWLHIVHKVYPTKQYCFWAILIDKQTLRPAFASSRPLVRGWHSFPATVIYTCSALATPTEVHICSGLNDSSTAIATFPRARLDAEWIALTRQAD